MPSTYARSPPPASASAKSPPQPRASSAQASIRFSIPLMGWTRPSVSMRSVGLGGGRGASGGTSTPLGTSAVRRPGMRAAVCCCSPSEVTWITVRGGARARQTISHAALGPARRTRSQRWRAPRALHTTGLPAARAAARVGSVVKL